MKFEVWSVGHIFYILSPFIVFTILYFATKKTSEKTKYIIGIILGAISLAILVVRNIDIYIRSGWDLEIIPLQVCHIGNIVTGLALITKKKWLILTGFCFNVIPALCACIFADGLANYATIWAIRPQSYIWGHLFIIVCALYGVFVYKPKFQKQDMFKSFALIASILVVAIICNSAFRALLGWEPNYFYLYDYKGTPLKFLYNVVPTSTYGWFSINWFYVLVLVAVFVAAYIGLYFLAKLILKELDKKQEKSTE